MTTIPRTLTDVVEGSFSDDDLTAGCGLTFDDNILHKPAPMAVFGYRPIVPGMMTTTRAFGIASPKGPFNADVYFGAALSSGEIVLFSAYPDGDLITLSAKKKDNPAIDLLARKDDRSVISPYSPGHFTVPLHATNFSTITNAVVSEYSKVINCGPDLAPLWLSIARSSKALFELLSSPNSDLEKELSFRAPPSFNMSYHGRDLPVYTALHINVQQPHVESGIIEYHAMVAEKEGNRVYHFDVACLQKGHVIFSGRYELVMLPMDFILRKMAMRL